MKKLILILSILSLSISTYCQYDDIYGNITPPDYSHLSKEQLEMSIINTNSNIEIGQGIVTIGTILTLVGIVLYEDGINSLATDIYGNSVKKINQAINGIYIGATGITLLGIGVPIWYFNNEKKQQIEVALVKFAPTSQNNIIGASIRLRF